MGALLLPVIILLVSPAAAGQRVWRLGVDSRRLGRELGAPGDGSRAGAIWERP